jgi:hypothetical protein
MTSALVVHVAATKEVRATFTETWFDKSGQSSEYGHGAIENEGDLVQIFYKGPLSYGLPGEGTSRMLVQYGTVIADIDNVNHRMLRVAHATPRAVWVDCFDRSPPQGDSLELSDVIHRKITCSYENGKPSRIVIDDPRNLRKMVIEHISESPAMRPAGSDDIEKFLRTLSWWEFGTLEQPPFPL